MIHRIDAAYHAPFLSACAATVVELGYASEIEADDLRALLKERYRSQDESSVFAKLILEKHPIMVHLQARLGLRGLNEIFFCWTSSRVFEDLSQSFWNLAQDFVKKSELMFNQNFYLFAGHRCDRRTLFSFFLIDCAKELHECANRIFALSSGLKRVFYAGVSAQNTEQSLEAKLAAHLGFEFDTNPTLRLWQLQAKLNEIYLILEGGGELLKYVFEQLEHNLDLAGQGERLNLLLDDWKAVLAQWKVFSGDWPLSLEAMEAKRLRLLASVIACRDVIGSVHEAMVSSIKTGKIKPQSLWPEAEKREIVTRLMSKGASLAASEQAIQSLQNYCMQHQVSPHELLDAELSRIDSHLDEPVLSLLKNIALNKGVGGDLSHEKQIVLRRKEQLSAAIQGRLGTILFSLFILALGSLQSCGIKTAPRSDVLDLRPSVPYHAEQRDKVPKPKAADVPAVPKQK